MTEPVNDIVVDTLKDQFAKLMIGTVAGWVAGKMTDKAYDKIKTVILAKKA